MAKKHKHLKKIDYKERLAPIYAKIPKINCKGLCHEACGAIAASKGEMVEMQRAGGTIPHARIKKVDDKHLSIECNFLNEEKRCSIYESRPWICRVWGVVEELPCEHGCTAERILTKEEANSMKKQVELLSGELMSNCTMQQLKRVMEDTGDDDTGQLPNNS